MCPRALDSVKRLLRKMFPAWEEFGYRKKGKD